MSAPPEKILRVLDPPPRGWERLQARRDSSVTDYSVPWLPLLSGSLAATVLMTFFSLSRHDVPMPFNAARLMGERSQGVSLQMLDNHRTTALPSGDPNVRLYWVEPARPSAD
jgi:hypothetical protein